MVHQRGLLEPEILARRIKHNPFRRRIEDRARRLSKLAETDPLTGLGNGLALMRYLQHGATSVGLSPRVSAIMMTADCPRASDRLCHLTTVDRLQRRIAEVLRMSTCSDDALFRLGHREFVIVRPATTLAQAVTWSENVRKKVVSLGMGSIDPHAAIEAFFGVVNQKSNRFSAHTIDHARKALGCALERRADNVCTWEMVLFDRAAARSPLPDTCPSDVKLVEVLKACRFLLGPTQRDHLTTHAHYVSNLAARLGKVLGMPTDDVNRVRTAGMFHDLGKFLVPEDILSKRRALTPDERFLLDRHPADGADMAGLLGVDRTTTEYIRFHHSLFKDRRVDGSNTSRQLPLGARILAVADAFVTMTSARPYCQPRSFPDALEELQRYSGTQFDPEVVDAVPKALLVPAR